MSVPLAPNISGRDTPIRRHETEYMPFPPSPTGGWGFALVLDRARGPTPGQASY